MTSAKESNKFDKALLLLFASLFAGNMSGVLLLPRTFSFLFLPLLLSTLNISLLPKYPQRLMGIWLLWSVFSLLFTPDLSEGGLQLILLITNFILAYEILYFAVRAKQPLYCIALGWLIALMINNIVGVWEIITDNHLSVSKFGSERELIIDGKAVLMHYANGFFSNYNAFVTFTCCAFPFLYYLVFNANSKLVRVVAFINLLVSIYTIFMDASRGGFLSMVVISAVYLYGLIKYRRARFGYVLVFGLLIGFVVVFWDSLAALIIGRQASIASIEDEARYKVWGSCLLVLADSFGMGSGVGGLAIAMEKVAGKGTVLAPHNAFFEILCQYGVLVFLVYLNFLRRVYINTKKRVNGPSNVVVYASFLALPFIFIINSVYLTNPFFWAFMMSLYVFSDSRYLICGTERL